MVPPRPASDLQAALLAKTGWHELVPRIGAHPQCGVYDISKNEAWVSIGINHDTAEFAVASIKRWWKELGQNRYGQPPRLLITADSSNSSRNRRWKYELQQLANRGFGDSLDEKTHSQSPTSGFELMSKNQGLSHLLRSPY